MPNSRPLLLAGIAIVAIAVGAFTAQFMHRAPAVIELSSGTLLPSTKELPEFQLVDNHGQAYTRTQLAGHWSVVFFGFTNCPDVCPTTLSTLAQVDKALVDLPTTQRPQFVFVSVDPKRDTPQQMNNYVSFFNPAFVGLTGEQTQIDLLTKTMGVPVAIHNQDNGNYSVDHSAVVFLLDPQARMAAVFSPPHAAQALVDDVRKVVQRPTP
ncbi:MAG: SCO family protein [Steroidobacteraceae bacterium]